jgi:hypothetical protein
MEAKPVGELESIGAKIPKDITEKPERHLAFCGKMLSFQ